MFWEYQLCETFLLPTAFYEDGRPARFHVVPGWMVNVDMTADGRRYSIGAMDVTGQIRHIAYKMAAGEAHGHGPLEAGAGRLVAARALARYATNLATSGAIPNAVLKHPGNLTAAQAEDLKWQWVEARVSSMGLPAVLSGGVDFETIQLSPADMALLDLSKFNESRIAVLLGVPPNLVGLPSGGDPLTYTNTQWIFVFHWRAGLSPKASAVMSALSPWLLPPGTTVELNRDEYTKPELKERAETWAILNGIRDTEGRPVLSRDEIRQLERYARRRTDQHPHERSPAMTETIEFRSAQTLDVHFPERVIELIAVPYDEPADVFVRGRPCQESVAPGAFAGVSGSVSVNRAHDVERPLGKVIAFHPDDRRGLRTVLRITPRLAEGDEVLALAADGLLSPSARFLSCPAGSRGPWTAAPGG